MKKGFIIIIVLTTLILGFSSLVLVGNADVANPTLENPIKATSTQALIDSVINFLWKITLIVVPLMIIVGGIIMVTSAGNPEQFKTGRNTIIWALAGFGLILLSKGLFNVVKNVIGAKGGP